MAKPKVVKVSSRLQLIDFYNSDKLVSGQKVCLLLPLKPNARHTKRKFKFAKGVLTMGYHTYCECCGPEFDATLTKADGTVLQLCEGWRGGSILL